MTFLRLRMQGNCGIKPMILTNKNFQISALQIALIRFLSQLSHLILRKYQPKRSVLGNICPGPVKEDDHLVTHTQDKH